MVKNLYPYNARVSFSIRVPVPKSLFIQEKSTMKNPTKRTIIKKPSKTSALSEKSLPAKDPASYTIKLRAMTILSLTDINYQ